MQISKFLKKAKRTLNKTTPEQTIEKQFVQYAKEQNCLALKLQLVCGRGWPDRTVLTKNGIFFIEFKRVDGKTSLSQKQWRNRLRNFGYIYEICYSITQAKLVLDKLLCPQHGNHTTIKK